MSNLSFTDLEYHFSSQRLHRYLIACSNDTDKAINLYKANMRVSQAFQPLLCLFEVVLRNQINLKLSTHFNDADWILNQRTHFMSNNRLGPKYYLRGEVNKTVSRLGRGGFTVISGKVIADLTFGFWTSLFERHPYQILQGKQIQIFTNLPANVGRREIFVGLSAVRDFRNRISHNEPVCFRRNRVSFGGVTKTHKTVRRMIRWIDPKLIKWIKDLDFVIEEINKARAILK